MFGKLGQFLETKEEGIIIPVIGSFYIVEKAEETHDKIYLDIRRLQIKRSRNVTGL